MTTARRDFCLFDRKNRVYLIKSHIAQQVTVLSKRKTNPADKASTLFVCSRDLVLFGPVLFVRARLRLLCRVPLIVRESQLVLFESRTNEAGTRKGAHGPLVAGVGSRGAPQPTCRGLLSSSDLCCAGLISALMAFGAKQLDIFRPLASQGIIVQVV